MDLLKKIASDIGYSTRELAAVMRYLTGYLMIEYINKRKMMAVYNCILTGEKNAQYLIDLSGKSDQPSFIKAFKREFGVNPTEAMRRKDKEKYEPPILWRNLSNNVVTEQQKEVEIFTLDTVDKEKDTMSNIFGISQEQFERAMEANDLMYIYGIDSARARVAYEFSERQNKTLEEAFEYLAGFDFPDQEHSQKFVDDYNDGQDNYSFEEIILQIMEDEGTMYAHFTCGLSVEGASNVAGEIDDNSWESITTMEPDLVKLYAYTKGYDFVHDNSDGDRTVPFAVCKRAYQELKWSKIQYDDNVLKAYAYQLEELYDDFPDNYFQLALERARLYYGLVIDRKGKVNGFNNPDSRAWNLPSFHDSVEWLMRDE